MIKKIGIILFLSLSLVGCSRGDKVLNANIPTEIQETQQVTETEEKEEVTLTKDKIKEVEDLLKNNTYMAFKEEVRSGVFDVVDALYTVQSYDIITDTNSKVTYVGVSDKKNSNDKEDFYYRTVYVSDLKKDKYYKNENNTEYVKEKYKTKVIDWNLLKYKNDFDLYSYLLQSFSVGENDVGYIDGDKEVYVKETKATKDMLKNVDYDTLDKCISTLVLKDNVPVSAETKVVFEKNKEKYYFAIKITFTEISNEKFTLKTLGIGK